MPLLTAKEVAQRLNLSSLTVIRLADSGALPAIEITRGHHRRCLRFRPEAIEQFISSKERQAAE